MRTASSAIILVGCWALVLHAQIAFTPGFVDPYGRIGIEVRDPIAISGIQISSELPITTDAFLGHHPPFFVLDGLPGSVGYGLLGGEFVIEGRYLTATTFLGDPSERTDAPGLMMELASAGFGVQGPVRDERPTKFVDEVTASVRDDGQVVLHISDEVLLNRVSFDSLNEKLRLSSDNPSLRPFDRLASNEHHRITLDATQPPTGFMVGRGLGEEFYDLARWDAGEWLPPVEFVGDDPLDPEELLISIRYDFDTPPLQVAVVQPPMCEPNQGDLDGDGSVTFADFLLLSANFGVQDAAVGDVDCNGMVDFADFLVLSQNFERTITAVQKVPEPSASDILLCSAATLFAFFRRQHALRTTALGR